jgi:hypothetical protein
VRDSKGGRVRPAFSAVMKTRQYGPDVYSTGDDDVGTCGPMAGDVRARDIADPGWADIAGATARAGHGAGETGQRAVGAGHAVGDDGLAGCPSRRLLDRQASGLRCPVLDIEGDALTGSW